MIHAIQTYDNNTSTAMNTSSVPIFKGNDVSYAQQSQDSFVKQSDKKDNTVKYALGIGTLAAVVGLGIAGYKGKLGKTVQKWLGGAEKAVEKEASKAADDFAGGASKLAKFSEDELKAISGKLVKDLSDEEFKKLFNTYIGEDRPVIGQIFEKSGLLSKVRDLNVSVGKFNEGFEKIQKEITPEVSELIDGLAGKDSFLFKPIKDITLGDIKPLIRKFADMQDTANKLGANIKFDDGMIAKLDLLDPSMKLKDFEGYLGEKININPNKTGVDIISQFIRTLQ